MPRERQALTGTHLRESGKGILALGMQRAWGPQGGRRGLWWTLGAHGQNGSVWKGWWWALRNVTTQARAESTELKLLGPHSLVRPPRLAWPCGAWLTSLWSWRVITNRQDDGQGLTPFSSLMKERVTFTGLASLWHQGA